MNPDPTHIHRDMIASHIDRHMPVSNWQGIALAILLASPPAALAQRVPDAGAALRETAPPARVMPPAEPDLKPLPRAPAPATGTPPGGPSFLLTAVRFTGNTVFSGDQLQPLAAERIGAAVTLVDLEAIASRVTEKYRAEGYVVAQAVVPVQELAGGVVEISVVEGTLGKVKIEFDPATRIRPSVIEGIVAQLEAGRPLHGPTLERVMLLLSDLPGVIAQAALEPGDESGSTDLVLSIVPGRRWNLAVDGDNFGSRSSSEYRAGVSARLNSPFALGDNLDARVQLGTGGRLAHGRLSYELPVGGLGTRLGASYARVDYELGKDFAELDADGRADVYDVNLSHPFIRSRSRNLFGRVGWQKKELEDRYGLIDRTEDKSISMGYAGFVYEQRDAWLGGGYTSAGFTAFSGDLDMNAQARATDRIGRHTAGGFSHWNYELSRLNALTRNANLFIGISGQFADKNLTSAEKISLGGPRGVRAYAPSEAAVDEGHVVNLELRYSVTPELSLQCFYDWGWGKYNQNPGASDRDNHVSLRGYGLGAFWGARDGLVLRATLAWRDTGRGEVDTDRVPRLYMQVSKSF